MIVDKLGYYAILTPLVILSLALLLHLVTITMNDIGHGYAFGLNSTSKADFNFAAAGDWGCTPNTKNTVENIISKNPELVLGLGDYAYRKQPQCWFRLIDPIYDKMKIVIGNHDHLIYTSRTEYYSSPVLLKQYMNYFNLSRQFYSFSYQNVHFIAMSTEVPYEPGSQQYKFVESDLQKTVSNKSIDWVVVFYHRLAYTSPSLVESVKGLRGIFHPLFEKYGVDLVIQGHSHNYQRTYPINYDDDKNKEVIVDKNKTNYSNPGGQIFTIVGTGGTPDIHNFTGTASFTATQFNAFGFLNVNVIHNGTVLEGIFYENDGTIKDHFWIEKSKKNNETSDSSTSASSVTSSSQPKMTNQYSAKFKIVRVLAGLNSPSDVVFLGPDDLLALEKNKGTVQRLINGQKLTEPLLDLGVSNKAERGLMGVATSSTESGTRYVYLYYTEAKHDVQDKCPESNQCSNEGTEPLGNRLYRYELSNDGTKLTNPELLLDLPATPGPAHNGGKMIIDNNKLYIIIGDVMNDGFKTQNYQDGKEPDGTGGILKIDENGNSSNRGKLDDKYPLNLYYAYGIRNGFGLDFDPVTGNLWDTENGPTFGDEINLVKPGSNSGWKDVQGNWNHDGGGNIKKGPLNLNGLVTFNGKGIYNSPEFTWKKTVGATGIKFFNSNKMGNEFKNTLFVGDFHNGNLYHFNLSKDRSELLLNGKLADKIADSPEELDNVIFAEGFGGITDLEVGPDGYLYVLSLDLGTLYKIVPK